MLRRQKKAKAEAMADKIGCDVLVGDSIEYLDAKEGKPACYYGKFWTQLGLDTMKAAAGKHLGGKLAPTGGWWEVKERKWELYAADGVKVRGPTLYPSKVLFSISTHVPDMTASYDSVAQGYVFQVPDKDLELTVWTVQSIKTLAAQLGVTVYDKTGYCRVLILQPSMLSSYVPRPHTPAQTGQTGQRQVAQQRLASMSCRYNAS